MIWEYKLELEKKKKDLSEFNSGLHAWLFNLSAKHAAGLENIYIG